MVRQHDAAGSDADGARAGGDVNPAFERPGSGSVLFEYQETSPCPPAGAALFEYLETPSCPPTGAVLFE